MPKLNQIIAIEKDVKGKAESALTGAYHLIQKAAPLSGISRVYTPKDEEGDRLPSESTLVQVNAKEVIDEVNSRLARLFDVVATKENTNTEARADVKVDGEVLLPSVPVTVLLFLEKQLVNLSTFIGKLPVLDPSETWEWSDERNCYVTEPSATTKTKKVPRNHQLAPATDKHPAQVQMYHEDVIVGTWATVKMSGALPAKEVAALQDRVAKLREAVKTAREEANSTPVQDLEIGRAVLDWVFSTNGRH